MKQPYIWVYPPTQQDRLSASPFETETAGGLGNEQSGLQLRKMRMENTRKEAEQCHDSMQDSLHASSDNNLCFSHQNASALRKVDWSDVLESEFDDTKFSKPVVVFTDADVNMQCVLRPPIVVRNSSRKPTFSDSNPSIELASSIVNPPIKSIRNHLHPLVCDDEKISLSPSESYDALASNYDEKSSLVPISPPAGFACSDFSRGVDLSSQILNSSTFNSDRATERYHSNLAVGNVSCNNDPVYNSLVITAHSDLCSESEKDTCTDDHLSDIHSKLARMLKQRQQVSQVSELFLRPELNLSPLVGSCASDTAYMESDICRDDSRNSPSNVHPINVNVELSVSDLERIWSPDDLPSQVRSEIINKVQQEFLRIAGIKNGQNLSWSDVLRSSRVSSTLEQSNQKCRHNV